MSNEWTNELCCLFLFSLPSLPGSEKIRKHSRCYCQATWGEGPLLPVCLVSLSGPSSVSGALTPPLHCSVVWSFASALCRVTMGNSMGGIWASGSRKDKKAVDDGYHTLGLFPCSKLHHNQKIRIQEFTRLCLSPNVPKDVRRWKPHKFISCYTICAITQSSPVFFFLLFQLLRLQKH